MQTKRLYPVPGRLLRDPVSGLPLPAEGKDINWEPNNPHRAYWKRALKDGDVQEIAPKAAPAPAPIGKED